MSVEKILFGRLQPAIGLVAAGLFSAYLQQTQHASTLNTFDEDIFPVQAVNWLPENPQPGNMFNEFNWGGYLLHRLGPQYPVFLDSQTDFYGKELVLVYEVAQAIDAAPGWKNIFDKYKISWVLIRPRTALAEELRNRGWVELYAGPTAVILKK